MDHLSSFWSCWSWRYVFILWRSYIVECRSCISWKPCRSSKLRSVDSLDCNHELKLEKYLFEAFKPAFFFYRSSPSRIEYEKSDPTDLLLCRPDKSSSAFRIIKVMLLPNNRGIFAVSSIYFCLPTNYQGIWSMFCNKLNTNCLPNSRGIVTIFRIIKVLNHFRPNTVTKTLPLSSE